MTLKEFFKTFDLFADAPNAVEKMRELILDSAVSGRLSPSDIDKRSVTLGEIVELISGQHLLAHEHNTSKKGIPYLTGPSDFGRVHPIPTRWTKTPKIVAQPGDILITVKGSGVGKTNLLVSEKTAIGRQLMAVRVTSAEREFIHIALKRAADHFQNAMSGIAIPGISREDILDLPVALPPLSEQKRIVSKVDELMALCDRLEAQQQEREKRHAALAKASLTRFAETPTPANLNLLFHKSYDIDPADLRRSILTLAVQGKLVPHDAEDEPVAAVLARSPQLPKPVRFEKRSVARIEGVAAMSVGPTTRQIPKNWSCVPLVRIARLESGHTPSRSRPDWWNGDVPWIGVVDARLHDGKTIFETRQHTNEDGLANSAARLLPKGTVCISRTASVGYVVILGTPMATSQDFVNWVPIKEVVSSDWLRLVFTAEKDGFKRFSKGAVHQTIYYPEWLSMHILLPPLPEQRRIVAKVDQLMNLVDALEKQLAESRTRAAELMDAVVAEMTAN